MRDDKTLLQHCLLTFQTPLGKCKHHYHPTGKFSPSPFSLRVSFILFFHNFTFCILFLNDQTVALPSLMHSQFARLMPSFLHKLFLKSYSREHLLNYLFSLDISSSPVVHKFIPGAEAFLQHVPPAPASTDLTEWGLGTAGQSVSSLGFRNCSLA